MHITEAETKTRLEREDNLVVFLKQKNGHAYSGGNPGPRIPECLKEIARETEAPNTKLGAMLACSPHTVAKIKTSGEKSLKDELQEVMTTARGSALDKLNAALGHITDEKLGGANLGVVSKVARDMASISRDMMPETKDAGLKVIIYNTPEREAADYDVIEVAAEKSRIHEGGV